MMAFWNRRARLVLNPVDHPVGTWLLIVTGVNDNRPVDSSVKAWAPSGEWVLITAAGWIRPYHAGLCEVLPGRVS